MKNLFFVILLFIPVLFSAQGKTIYIRGGAIIDPSFVDVKVGDTASKVNSIFHFKNDTRNFFIKILNLDGKTYAQGTSEFIKLDFNSRKGGDLHRKVEKLTNIKIEDGKFISDQLKASFIFLKEKGSSYNNEKPTIKLMICSKDKKGTTTCRINDDDVEVTPDEFPGKYPQTSFTRLGEDDLKGKKIKELDLMKNEIYARYGYRFSNAADQKYFYNQSWYEPITDNKMIELNDLESDNVAMIELYKSLIPYKNLNKKTFSHVLPLETSSSTLYDKDALKSVKYVKQDSAGGRICIFTEYNKRGIAISQQNCTTKKYDYVNYFNKDLIVQHIDNSNDTYFYYDNNGLPYKTVKLDYGAGTTEETFYHYDENENIVKKDIYQNNDFNSSVYYDYDEAGNLIKEYYKDDDKSEHMVTEYIYDENNLLIGKVKDNDLHCDYTYNELNDIILETKCYKLIKEREYIKQKIDIKVLETKRTKEERLQSVNLIEKESLKSSKINIEVKYH